MPTNGQTATEATESTPQQTPTGTARGGSRALTIARKGVETGHDFAKFYSNLLTDILEGTVTPDVANALSRAGGNVLKVVEMQHKYGTSRPRRSLNLTGDEAKVE